MKADATTDGEFKTLSSLPGVTIRRFGDSMLRPDPADSRVVAAAVREGLSLVRQLLERDQVDVLVIDEGNVACLMGLIEPCELLAAIEPAGQGVEVIITGRGAPTEIIERADLVTEMVARKHPYDNGVKAREGVDF
jgi:cob(I)alamin adenosyltransferase